MISLNHIALSFGGRKLFADISFLINTKDRIGLVGNNGSGKTTLLKVIMGLIGPESGNIEKATDMSMGYLPQQMKHRDCQTLYAEVKTTFAKINALQEKITKLEGELAETEDVHCPQFLKSADKLADMNEMAHTLGISKVDEQIEKILTGLGFEPSDFNKPTDQFSGGWRMRIELAKILLKDPDILLLDEPTNHLDIESIQWLEEFLKDYNGAALIISHDRTFLDNTTSRTIEISLGRIYDYKASYSKYVLLRQERKQQQLSARKNQQKTIESNQVFIDRFRYKNTKATQVQSRIKKLEKMERIEVDEEDLMTINISFPEAARSGNTVVEAKGLSKSYGDNRVLENIGLHVQRAEKIAFVGKNGEGKTTLSRIIVGDLDFTGSLQIGHHVKIGYFAQNQDALLDESLTVYETIERAAEGQAKQRIRSLLVAFLFRDDDIDKKVKVLSGGERSRLALIKLLVEPFNFLVLDEPTNHLDMRSKDLLKQALCQFSGTLILVSHDREFLEGLANKVYEFKGHTIISHPGSIHEFLEKKKLASLKDLEIRQKKPVSKSMQTPTLSLKKEYQDKKAYNRLFRGISKKISDCENAIASLEEKLDALAKKMESPDYSYADPSSHKKFEQYSMIKKDLDEKMAEWERLHRQLSQLKEEDIL